MTHKPDRFDRALKAMAKVGKTKAGRQWLRENGDVLAPALAQLAASCAKDGK